VNGVNRASNTEEKGCVLSKEDLGLCALKRGGGSVANEKLTGGGTRHERKNNKVGPVETQPGKATPWIAKKNKSPSNARGGKGRPTINTTSAQKMNAFSRGGKTMFWQQKLDVS